MFVKYERHAQLVAFIYDHDSHVLDLLQLLQSTLDTACSCLTFFLALVRSPSLRLSTSKNLIFEQKILKITMDLLPGNPFSSGALPIL